MDLYKILELEDNSSIDDIKKSYRRLARKYHPDKNKDEDATLKFIKIQSAYEILSNDDSRKEYIKLDSQNKDNFDSFIEKIFDIINMNSDGDDFIDILNIKIDKNKIQKLRSNFLSSLNNLNLNQLFDFFMTGDLPDNFNDINQKKMELSESETESWQENDALYFDKLPIEFHNIDLKSKENNKTLWITQDISLEDILRRKSKKSKNEITIKRFYFNIPSLKKQEYFSTNFKFKIKSKWIVFLGGGDQKEDGSFGDLVIKLNLPDEFEWNDNFILLTKKINLYQYLYGININIVKEKSLQSETFKKILGRACKNYSNEIELVDNIKSWVPVREGNVVIFYHCKKSEIKVGFKLLLEIKDYDKKKEAIQILFND